MRLLSLIIPMLVIACSSSSLPGVPGGESDGGVPAVVGVDAGPERCSLVDQDCAEGEKCTILRDADRTIGCTAVVGHRVAGESCDTSAGAGDDCAPGLYCDASTSPAVCVELCAQEPADTCSAGGVCALSLPVADGVQMCAQVCDPVAQDCERDGFACYPSRWGPSCAQIGGGGDTVGEGAPCGFANECDPGLACLRVGQAWSCFQICDPFVAYGGGCSVAQLCNRVDDESWGICIDQ